jgi:hypothetical protein
MDLFDLNIQTAIAVDRQVVVDRLLPHSSAIFVWRRTWLKMTATGRLWQKHKER